MGNEKINYCIECRFATSIGVYRSAGQPGLFCEHPKMSENRDLVLNMHNEKKIIECYEARNKTFQGALICPYFSRATNKRNHAMNLMFHTVGEYPIRDCQWTGNIPEILRNVER